MGHDNDNGDLPPTGTDGPQPPDMPPGVQPENVISLKDWKADKGQPVKPLEDPTQWPKIQKQQQQQQQQKEPEDPPLRRYILSLEAGDITVDGIIGLTNSFLAIGDVKGNIKFAAAAGKWHYATDITNDPNYKIGYIVPLKDTEDDDTDNDQDS